MTLIKGVRTHQGGPQAPYRQGDPIMPARGFGIARARSDEGVEIIGRPSRQHGRRNLFSVSLHMGLAPVRRRMQHPGVWRRQTPGFALVAGHPAPR